MNYFYSKSFMQGGLPSWMMTFAPLLIILVIWSIFWKGLALWHSSRKGDDNWFILMLILNTAGILEIIYLFFVIKLKFNELLKKQ